jgi:hypothetical protein
MTLVVLHTVGDADLGIDSRAAPDEREQTRAARISQSQQASNDQLPDLLAELRFPDTPADVEASPPPRPRRSTGCCCCTPAAAGCTPSRSPSCCASS